MAFNHDLPFFGHLKQHNERHKQFAGYMRAVTESDEVHFRHLVKGFDWESLGTATVVDVGGSSGYASVALAKASPNLRFIVQDLPEVVKNSSSTCVSSDLKQATRIKFQAHNFFDKQPVHGADVYLFRMILHDWTFDNAVNIISNTVPTLRRKPKIIIMDTVLPEPWSILSAAERLLRVRDLTMMQFFNSGKRSIEDWKAIFRKAGLEVREVNQLFGSNMSLIVLRLKRCEAVL
ncbi:hypothetical protein KCU71_g1386, partial [Aureobasidium melanogenum]